MGFVPPALGCVDQVTTKGDGQGQLRLQRPQILRWLCIFINVRVGFKQRPYWSVCEDGGKHRPENTFYIGGFAVLEAEKTCRM